MRSANSSLSGVLIFEVFWRIPEELWNAVYSFSSPVLMKIIKWKVTGCTHHLSVSATPLSEAQSNIFYFFLIITFKMLGALQSRATGGSVLMTPQGRSGNRHLCCSRQHWHLTCCNWQPFGNLFKIISWHPQSVRHTGWGASPFHFHLLCD